MIRENRTVGSCNHEAFIAEKHVYCPDCGDTGVEMMLTRRIAGLETLLRAEQGYTVLNEARIAELEAEKMEIARHDSAQVLANDRLLLTIEGIKTENQRLRDTILYAKGRMKAYGIVDARVDLPGGGEK